LAGFSNIIDVEYISDGRHHVEDGIAKYLTDGEKKDYLLGEGLNIVDVYKYKSKADLEYVGRKVIKEITKIK
jgi:hypothetical protein